MKTVAVVSTENRNLSDSLDDLFSSLGGLRAVVPIDRRVALKPNAVHFSPETYTNIDLLDALMAYLRDHGVRRLAMMENVTAGNFSRLVFHATGYKRLCKKYGAEAIYLDEQPVVEVQLRDEDEPTRIPKILYDDFIVERENNFYLSVPKLKTHSMTKVTLGVKNQQAFPIHADRMHRHNHETLHRRLASLYDLIHPDFCLIEGLTAVIHGHFPATALLSESVVSTNVLIAGPDTLAVDAVGAKILGYAVDEVDHLRLCAEWGLGESNLNNIDVIGLPLGQFEQRYPHTLLGRYHPDVCIIEGKEQACVEGCKSNSLCIQEMLYNDYLGKGGWTLVFGKGVDKDQLADAPGPLLVVGPCAVAELREWLQATYPKRKMYFLDVCNDLTTNTLYQARLMGIKPISMSPVNPLTSGWLLLRAKLNKTTARVPPIFG